MPTRAALTAGAWVSGAVLAASGVAGALIVLGDRAFPSVHVLSQAQVHSQLTARPTVTVTITPSSRPAVDSPAQSPMSSPVIRSSIGSPAVTTVPSRHAAAVFRGGTVFASCSGEAASLTHRIPAQGYGIDRVWPGPATAAGVEFSSPEQDDLVTITCSAGYPVFTSQQEMTGGPGQGGGSGWGGGNGGGGKGGHHGPGGHIGGGPGHGGRAGG
jgi:hypothetical protein